MGFFDLKVKCAVCDNEKWTIPQGMFKKTIDGNRIYTYNDIIS